MTPAFFYSPDLKLSENSKGERKSIKEFSLKEHVFLSFFLGGWEEEGASIKR